MTTLKTLDSSILSLLILVVICIHAHNRSEKLISFKLFMPLVQANMLIIIIDILGWLFNGLPGSTYFALNLGFNLLFYIIVLSVPILWVLYMQLS